MALQFILGRSGTGKTTYCLNEITEAVLNEPIGNNIVYICPEQMTFQIERSLAKSSGSIRAGVFSFTRLAWKVFQEVGGITRIHLDNQGIEMMLRKVVEGQKEQLKVYERAIEQSGFYTQLAQMIEEFKQNGVSVESLSMLSEQTNNELLKLKLHDLSLIYREYEQAMTGKYVDSKDYLRLLMEKIPQSTFLKEATIYIDGFHSFSLQEIEVILALQKVCNDMKIILTLEPNAIKEYSLFHLTGTTYERIERLTRENGVTIEEPLLFSTVKRFETTNLNHLEQHFERRPVITAYEDGAIHFTLAQNFRGEIEKIAREICRLVEEEKVRYRDISIMARNIGDYMDLCRTIFKDYRIPFYSDEKKKMIHHPFIECILSTFEVLESNWRLDAVFRMLKTGIFLEGAIDDIDLLENYCLAYGIKGSKWTKQEPWEYNRYGLKTATKTTEERQKEEVLNDLRNRITTPLVALQKKMKKATNVKEMCFALYTYFEEMKFANKLEQLAVQAEEQDEILISKEHIQAWEKTIGLLEQLVEMLGEEQVSFKTFMNVLRTGLEGLEFTTVPSSLDEVIIANMDHSRIEETKYLFLLGINEGVIPSVRKEEGMFSDEDRERLQQLGVEVNPTAKQRLLDEEFIFYMACVRPSKGLYLSCSLGDSEEKALFPSAFYKRMKEMFPIIEEVYVSNDLLATSEADVSLVTREIPTFSLLMEKLTLYKDKKIEMSFWWDVYNYYIKKENNEFYRFILQSLFYQNKTKPLEEVISTELYGEEIVGSVSRIEQFNSCPYAHFANHGLKLRERDVYNLEAPAIGQLFHDALKKVTDTLLENNYTWADLTREMCQQLAVQAIEEIAPQIQREILLSSNRYQYIKHKLQQIIYRATVILAEQGKNSGFTPIGLEVPFGENEKIPSLRFQLPNGRRMGLVGRIDRVDKAQTENGSYLRIVDYKSTSKDLDLAEVYYGLSLQMLTYLDIAVTHSRSWIGERVTPAGVLYFHVHNPMLDIAKMMKEELPSESMIESELLKRFKMKGLVLADEETVRLMDTTLQTGYSDIISVGLKRDGGFYSASSVASLEEFNKLTNHVRNNYIEVGTKITEGNISVEPYKYKNKVPCTFCNYKSVCQFDDTLGANKYRVLKPYSRKEVLELLEEEEGADNGIITETE
ncbi:MAG: helicase-exonuclease AddAB subunit AddB [Bacillaceae bacterium]